MKFVILEGDYGVYQVQEIPNNLIDIKKSFYTLTISQDEISIVCLENSITEYISKDIGWKVLKIDQVLDFGMIGIIASISNLLAQNKISIFVISTYNTDYILVKKDKLEQVRTLLIEHDHKVKVE